ncbi:MAG: TrmH family RNA methyltransferase [Planctomycetota bacterium]
MPDRPTITSPANPRVKWAARLRAKARERRRQGVLLAEGAREVDRAMAAGLRPVAWFGCGELLGDSRGPFPGVAGVEPTWVSAAVLRKLAFHDRPEGQVAVFETPSWSLEGLELADDKLLLVAVGTEKPGNLGAMARTAAAAGCAAVIAVGPAVDVFGPSAVRNSTGAVFTLPVVVVEDAAAAIAWLKARRVRVVAALADGPGSDADDCFTRPGWAAGRCAVVVGPEHAGLDDDWRAAADVALRIPQATGPGVAAVDSLNAANAAAVLLFEAVRRRRVSG